MKKRIPIVNDSRDMNRSSSRRMLLTQFTIIWLLGLLGSLIGCSRPNAIQLDGDAPAQAAALESLTPTPAPTATLQPTAQVTLEPTLEPRPTVHPTLAATLEAKSTPDATADYQNCLRNHGRIEQMFFSSKIISDTVRYRIYLPACYDALPEKRFPVLYLLHGQGFSDDQWERLGVPQKMDELLRAGSIPPFLIVMPYDTSQKEAYEDKFDATFPLEIVPWIDSHYRTMADRQHRAVGGLSRGSGWAVHFGLSDWKTFGAIGLHSIAIFWSDVSSIKRWLSVIPPDQMPAFYIDIGDREEPKLLQSATWFENLLTDQGIAHEWHLYHGYHDENYWQAHVEYYLIWYAQQIGK